VIGLINIFNWHQVVPYLIYGACFIVFMVFAAGRLSKLTALKMLTEPGLFGVTGRMGRGKSYLMTLFAFYAMKQRRVVFANYSLHGTKTYEEFLAWIAVVGRDVQLDKSGDPIGWLVPKDHRKEWPWPVEYSNWAQMLDAPMMAMILIDEAQIWWQSADHAAPTHVAAWVTRIRKRQQTVLWGSQDFSFVGRWLRVLSGGIWECRKVGATHRYTLVDVSQAGKDPKVQKTMARFRVRRKKKVMALYDTMETVSSSREWGSVPQDVAG
jgi:hypothetical protein